MYICGGNIPQLEDARLILRQLELDDAGAVLRCWSEVEVREYSGIPELETIELAKEMIIFLNRLSTTEDGIRWGIVDKQSGAWMGSCGFNMWQLEGAYRGEIGCELSSLFWGQGYMNEALDLIIQFGFEVMGLNRIEALVDPSNARASRLFTSLHFILEGNLREYRHTPDGFRDVHVYSLLRKDWEQQ
ncbi:ribosomal-protein-alanine N-acetyltransferase [Paenibacillus sp. DS2015]|uniref:GNAT family N-acetyltransferase n=1 Tax=Paenibacillus sp. DS2015 TaxID=3373917 RepID=UPI003D1AAD26